MKRIIAYVALLALALALVVGGCGGDDPAPQARPVTRQETLQIASGRGNEVGDDFTVPSGCGRQTLTYSGELISNNSGGGFINFRVYDTAGNPADSAVGPIDLDEEREGAAMWTLEPGTYAVEVTADGAEWSYKLQCR